jgi:uncharacterized protein YqgC (DUF456 family)
MDLGAAASVILAITVMFLGLAGIFIPIIPSTPLIWFGIFLYGVVTGFEKVTTDFLLTISALALATVFLDWMSTIWSMKKFHASTWSVFGAVIGGLIGTLMGPIATWVVGPILGGIIAGMMVGNDNVFAVRRGRVTVVAFLGGTVVKLTLGLLMIGLFFLRITGRS